MKPIHWRDSGRRDLDDAAAWYAHQGGLALELRFIAAVEASVDLASRHPAVGSTRHAGFAPDLPVPLRFLPVHGFERYLVYYIDLPERIEAIRVWDASRGLAALMEGDE
ncbi:MAG: type II toxin-antitoxin system RelE/ParE family toxin [Pseudoxanthomonas sp.]